jgi:xanthine dehydrogenase accessory factor
MARPSNPPRLPKTALPHEVLRAALAAVEAGRRVVLATVVSRHGSAPSTPGQKLAVVEDGAAIGTVGGGAVERAVLGTMAAMLDDPASLPRVEQFRLGAELGMCCGGSVELLLEPIRPAAHVLVIGAGHVGAITAPLLAALGFRVRLCDAREEAADASRLATSLVPLPAPAGPDSPLEVGHAPAPPTAPVELLCAEHDDPETLAGFPERLDRSACLVMTHDHQLDQAAVEWALARGFGFVGGVGSRAKAARTRARLEAKDVGVDDIDRVRMPVGADIGARTPTEIAVAIAAEMIEWRARLLPARRAAAARAAAPAGAR